MITRNQVIQNAREYINIQGWTPVKDEYKFSDLEGDTFYSCFTREEPLPSGSQQQPRLREYRVVPYVYGKPSRDTIPHPIAIRQEIENGTCPGGWDRITGRGTARWQGRFGASPMRNLAGIDCGQYVMKCWGFDQKRVNGTEYGTPNLPNLCVRIKKRDLKSGDILLKQGHVVIFDRWTSDTSHNRAYLYEATGTPEPEPLGGHPEFRRPFNPQSDEHGCVVYHQLTLTGGEMATSVEIEGKNGNFTPYSPFPQFEEFEVLSTSDFFRPTISIKCRAKGEIEVEIACFNDQEAATTMMCAGENTFLICCIPQANLQLEPNLFYIRATNRIANQSFREEFALRFGLASCL